MLFLRTLNPGPNDYARVVLESVGTLLGAHQQMVDVHPLLGCDPMPFSPQYIQACDNSQVDRYLTPKRRSDFAEHLCRINRIKQYGGAAFAHGSGGYTFALTLDV